MVALFNLLLVKASQQQKAINIPSSPPIIINHPKSIEITEAEAFHFSIEALNDEGGYAWYKDNIAISGATKNVYGKNTSMLSDGGQYYCTVTNLDGKILKSDVATLLVNNKQIIDYQGRLHLFFGDSLTAGDGTTGTSAYNRYPYFVMGANTLSKQIWRATNEPNSAIAIFGYPGANAAQATSMHMDSILEYLLTIYPTALIHIGFGTNDLNTITAQQCFDDVKTAALMFKSKGQHVKIAVRPPLNSKDPRAITDYNQRRKELHQLYLTEFAKPNSWIDSYVNLYLNEAISADDAPNNPAWFVANDLDGGTKLHYTDELCSIIANIEADRTRFDIDWSDIDYTAEDLSGGINLPMVEAIPTTIEGLASINLSLVNGIFTHKNYSDNGTDWTGIALIDKKISAEEDGAFEMELPLGGQFGMLGIRFDKKNTAFEEYFDALYSDAAGTVATLRGNSPKFQVYEGDILRFVRKVINGVSQVSGWKSNLDKTKFRRMFEYTINNTGAVYLCVCVRQDGKAGNYRVSNNCVSI